MEKHDRKVEQRQPIESYREKAPSMGECSCCDGPEADFEYYATKVRLETEAKLIDPNEAGGVLDVELHGELQDALGQLLNGSPVTTLDDWVAEVRERTGGGPITIEDLCHESEETGHWGEVDSERYQFTCFFDAVVLATLTDDPVDIRTESPTGTEIEASITGTGDFAVDPPETLVSFGVVTTPEAIPDGEPTREDIYASVCPVVKAFPSPQAYDRWHPAVPATTVGIPLAEATSIADALVA
jgi:hypothetical protein